MNFNVGDKVRFVRASGKVDYNYNSIGIIKRIKRAVNTIYYVKWNDHIGDDSIKNLMTYDKNNLTKYRTKKFKLPNWF